MAATTDSISPSTVGYHIMAKPSGPLCNLDCSYCFYLEKTQLYPKTKNWRMSEEVLEAFVRNYCLSQPGPVISFAWQGGEPTLMGIPFFKRALELQKKHCPSGKSIENAFQTNATLINKEWASFLAKNNFLVGVSIDGPPELHNRYRIDRGGKPTHARVLAGVKHLLDAGTEFNTLTVVNNYNADHPLEVYHYLKEIGSTFLQFIPIIERNAPTHAALPLAGPPDADDSHALTNWSVTPQQWGKFLCRIFDNWIRHDVGKTFVQLFEVQLGILVGQGSSICVFAPTCGTGLAMEHNGDVYSCDHYVYPEYLLGNVCKDQLADLVTRGKQQFFGQDKFEKLPRYCKQCPYVMQCYGECPKNRCASTPDGEPGLNMLCSGYRKFFQHSRPLFLDLLRRIRAGMPAESLMHDLRAYETTGAKAKIRPNDPCPCGSGKKFKKCCKIAAVRH